MIHDLIGAPATVFIVWRIDFVPDTALPNDCTPFVVGCIRPVETQWMDVSGPGGGVGISSPIYPVFNALRRMGHNGRYTFPDQATGAQRDLIGPGQTWTPDHPVTLIQTAGHLHPGGLSTDLRVRRGTSVNRIFTLQGPLLRARRRGVVGRCDGRHAIELARQASRRRQVERRRDLRRGEGGLVRGDGDHARGRLRRDGRRRPDAMSDSIPDTGGAHARASRREPKPRGWPDGLPDPRTLPSAPTPSDPITINQYAYEQGDLYAPGAEKNPPKVLLGHSLIFRNLDDPPPGLPEHAYHTITACKAPCNRSTGIAYPIANGPVTFDSGQLGFNSGPFNAPAVERDTWSTPKNLPTGTYSYFCRVHPFMRGSFRVVG